MARKRTAFTNDLEGGASSGRRGFWWFLKVAVLIALLSLVGYGAATLHSLRQLLPDPDLGSYRAPEATLIYDRSGKIIAKVFEENREFVPLTKIPQNMRDATIASEDRRFYQHQGVDVRGVARALWRDVVSGRFAEGASTITQQLARNIYLSPERSLNRKIKEAMLAIEIERRYSKDEILQLYLNEIYYGSRAYGVQAAARAYFGKDVSRLTLPECALIAAMPKRPSEYSPYENRDLAKEKRDVVLDLMAQQGYITEDESEKAKAQRIRLVASRPPSSGLNRAPEITSYVLNELSREFGADVVYRSGWRIYTTVDLRMQEAARAAVEAGLKSAKKQNKNIGEAALVCLRPKTGEILAMVGGKEAVPGGFNRAVQAKRQPGSSFKFFVYLAATDSGFKPTNTIVDSPVSYPSYGGTKRWRPKNADGKYRGTVTLRTGFASSINVVAVKLLDEVGVQKCIDWAHTMGIRSRLDPNLSLALGTSEVSPLEMASAFGVVAADGKRAEPVGYSRVTDRDGRLIKESRFDSVEVMDERLVKTMRDYTRWVVASGTGTRAGRGVPNARGKTGTSSDYKDAWFIGFTDDLSCAVWLGNDDSTPMRRVFGGSWAAPIWADFMAAALRIQSGREAPSRETTVASGAPASGAETNQEESETAGEASSVEGSAADEVPGDASRTDAGEGTPQGGVAQGGTQTRQPRQPATPPGSTSPAPPAGERMVDDGGHEFVKVRLCSESGLLATEGCPLTHDEVFPVGKQPKTYCTLHGPPPGRSRSGGH
jgi:penicillin-binding protein 1A